MTDYVRVRLADHAFPPASRWEIADAILADPSLLIVARPKCEHRIDLNGLADPTTWTCPDCGGTGFLPMVALPAKVVDDVIAAIVVVLDQSQHVAHRTRLVREGCDVLIEAVRLAQEARP